MAEKKKTMQAVEAEMAASREGSAGPAKIIDAGAVSVSPRKRRDAPIEVIDAGTIHISPRGRGGPPGQMFDASTLDLSPRGPFQSARAEQIIDSQIKGEELNPSDQKLFDDVAKIAEIGSVDQDSIPDHLKDKFNFAREMGDLMREIYQKRTGPNQEAVKK